jgi:hypothetical protein
MNISTRLLNPVILILRYPFTFRRDYEPFSCSSVFLTRIFESTGNGMGASLSRFPRPRAGSVLGHTTSCKGPHGTSRPGATRVGPLQRARSGIRFAE